MNYIGSKQKLSDFIFENVSEVVGDIKNKVFCDLFAGTGIIGRTFKPSVKSVISNDLEYYSYVLNKHYIENTSIEASTIDIIKTLNELEPKEGFIFNEYGDQGSSNRLYFSTSNAKKIDAIRMYLESIRTSLRDQQYYFLLCSVLESSDKVANTASVYGAYLKALKKSASNDLVVEPADIVVGGSNHKVYNEDANTLIQKIQGDILYLDPPYNERQYGANYHLLNTIAKYDSFKPKGITGLREYNKSNYCIQGRVFQSFYNLIKNAKFQYIFLSYNNEGLMNDGDIRRTMSRFGEYSLVTKKYQRFKADSSREHTSDSVTEYLHILKKF